MRKTIFFAVMIWSLCTTLNAATMFPAEAHYATAKTTVKTNIVLMKYIGFIDIAQGRVSVSEDCHVPIFITIRSHTGTFHRQMTGGQVWNLNGLLSGEFTVMVVGYGFTPHTLTGHL